MSRILTVTCNITYSAYLHFTQLVIHCDSLLPECPLFESQKVRNPTRDRRSIQLRTEALNQETSSMAELVLSSPLHITRGTYLMERLAKKNMSCYIFKTTGAGMCIKCRAFWLLHSQIVVLLMHL